MNSQQNPITQEAKKPSITFSAIARQILRGWPWFLVAFLLFLLISLRTSSNLQLGVSEYKMTLMSRFGADRNVIKMNEDKSELLWDKVPPYTVEQLYGFLVASDIIYQAGKRVGFDVDYSQKKQLRTYDVFNDLPFQLFFLDAYDNDTFELKAEWQEKGVFLSEVSGTFRGETLGSPYSFASTVAIGDTIQTPVGRVVCKAQAISEKFPSSSLDLSRPIKVKKIDTNRALTRYDKDMDMKREEDRTLTIEMSVAGSARRVIELMTAMIEVCEETVKAELLKDIEENESFLKQSLAKLDTLPLPADVKSSERAILLEKLTRNETNRAALNLQEVLTVTDPPVSRPPSSASGYFKIILFIVLMTVALLGVYYTRIARGTLLSREQLPALLRQRLFGPFTFKPRGKENENEKSLLALDPLRIAYEGAKYIFTISPQKPREMLWFTSLLAKNISRSGRKVVRLHYHTDGTVPPKGCQGIGVKAGYIGGETFWKDLTSLSESFGSDTLVLISADKELQRQLLPLFNDFLYVVVREKSLLKKIEEDTQMLLALDGEEGHSRIRTAWIELPLYASTRK